MRRDAVPAISRNSTDIDRAIDAIRTLYDGVTFSRGYGVHDRTLELVDHDCPACSHDRMIRETSVSPETRSVAAYCCCNPVYPHFASDKFSYHQTAASTPRITGGDDA